MTRICGSQLAGKSNEKYSWLASKRNEKYSWLTTIWMNYTSRWLTRQVQFILAWRSVIYHWWLTSLVCYTGMTMSHRLLAIGKSSLFILAWWSVIDCGQSTSPVLTYWHNSINLYTISIWVIYCWQLLIVNQIGLWKNYNYHQNQHHWLLLVKSASSTWQQMNHEWHE